MLQPKSSRRFFVGALALAAGLAVAGAVQAAPPGNAGVRPADVRAAQRVIQSQLNAFASDDAKAAYAHATPGIRARFGTAEVFLAMVRQSYPMVYRPANVVFQKPVGAAGAMVMPVLFTDADGDEWIATYRLQRQKNGRWLIDGCTVAQEAGHSA